MQIYKIVNRINNKVYVGKDENERPQYFGSGKIIRLAIKKYGKENFSKEILETCDERKELCERERYWIKTLDCISPNGYNISTGGNGGDILTNHPDREAIIAKRAKSNTGKKRSEEFCKMCSVRVKERAKAIDSAEWKRRGEKIMETKRKRWEKEGKSQKEIEGQKVCAAKLSRWTKSDEGRKKLSEVLKGKSKPLFSNEHRKNIGKASKGRKIPGKRIRINDVEYPSLHEASRSLNVHVMTIRNRLVNKNFKDWNYV